MSVSDAIVVGEGWISEHFFTTDSTSQSFQARVVERRKAWDAEGAEERATARSRFLGARQALEVDIAALDEHADVASKRAAAEDVHKRLIEVLGLGAHGLHTEQDGPVIRISSPGITRGAPLAVVLATPVGAVEDLLAKDGPTLPEPVVLDEDGRTITSAARLLSALFVADDAPAFALVLAGRWALLTERERWAEGRYLAVDVQLVCERNDVKKGGEVDRALTCLSAESIAPNADGDVWWASVLEESVKHTVGVSKDLRDGVRLSIEIIANEVVDRRRERGMPPLPADEAQVLAKQSLRFLYRILFLLYAEASPELGVLPVGAPEYAQGYSLDRLRELVQVELASPQARTGTHLYDSLGVLFRLVDAGHAPKPPADASLDGGGEQEGLTFNSLRADLFRPQATAHIDAVGLGNARLQDVLEHLLLSKKSAGRDRGFISYAELGINQLGAVYEGLMSYTGFFAETDLYEVAKGGDSSKGSWVVPVDRADGIAESDFVRVLDEQTGERRPVLHAQGSFVFRLAGRERQQSASFYTPEVLTRFTVGQALEELLDQDGRTTPAAEILDLTVCEPALGSGAFAIEAVRQLAEQYLRRRQDELGERIEPDEYPRRLQEVKAYLALHNVYGVDLNATAVELAEISLWLDTMVAGLEAPWFGLHLRRGNSLIGARRAVFRRDQVTSKSHLKDVPRDVPLTSLADDVRAGRLASDLDGGIHHFLLPAAGWGSAVDAKEAKTLAPDALARLKAWRSSVQAKPTKAQVDALVDLSYRVESLWQIAFQRLEIAEREIRRAIPVWGVDGLPAGGAVQREQIEEALADAKGAYQRLRRVMDAWCALWFWPLTDTLTTRVVDGATERLQPPSLAQWIDALQMLLGRHAGKGRTASGGNQTLGAGTTWDELGGYESVDLGFASVRTVEAVLDAHPWLRVCEAVAAQQGFFHWELDFAAVFARGGFDLQVGNPPWVRPRSDVDALLAEGDPWWQLAVKPSEPMRAAKRVETLALDGVRALVIDGTADVAATSAFAGSEHQYPHLVGLQPDLYRCFMEQAWRHASVRGSIGLIHPETHFTDERAAPLRRATYQRLRRHWHFVNQLKLFEIGNVVEYGVHIYSSTRNPRFLQASSIYHPETVLRSLIHDGSGDPLGQKTPSGEWDTRPHASRIELVDEEVLSAWRALLEPDDVSHFGTRMLYSVNSETATMFVRIAKAGRMSGLSLSYTMGWNETGDFRDGVIHRRWGAAPTWEDSILQGPHIHVATPFYKQPNSTMKSHRDWSAVDLEALEMDATPVTAYKRGIGRSDYDRAYPHWVIDAKRIPVRGHYRVSWRSMADPSGERTLIPAIIPPGAAHVSQSIYSLGAPDGDLARIADAAAWMASLIADLMVRAAPKSSIPRSVIERLPWAGSSALESDLRLRILRLNCLTSAYAELWETVYSPDFQNSRWAAVSHAPIQASIEGVTSRWGPSTPLRKAVDRRQAIVEIDAIVALLLEVTPGQLCAAYRHQFPVLYGYDRAARYDSSGRLVPNAVVAVWRVKGDRITERERTVTNHAGNTYTYELPFVTLDREADMRQAYAHFEQLLRDRT